MDGCVVEAEEDRPRDDEILEYQYALRAADAAKMEFVGNKEPLAVLAAEYDIGNSVFKEKVEKLSEIYGAIRRTRGDGNCFFRSFMFSYLEHILETKDEGEVTRVQGSIEQSRKTLIDLGYPEFTFEDFLSIFLEQLESVLPGRETSISLETLIDRCRDEYISNYGITFSLQSHVLCLKVMLCKLFALAQYLVATVVMFFRFITSGEIRRRAEFFEPFVLGLSNMSVMQFCKAAVEPMGEESDHVHIIALSDALGVPVRVVYLDRSSIGAGKTAEVNHHDFIPTEVPEENKSSLDIPVILLYRPGHYDILYRK